MDEAFQIHLQDMVPEITSCFFIIVWLFIYLFFLLCVQAGHPFQQRCAQSAYSNGKPRSEAPVFLLFLDCVWQILRQFPCSFQFNEHFLVTLFEHAYASQFGTFLGNSAAERSVSQLHSSALTFADEAELFLVKSIVLQKYSINSVFCFLFIAILHDPTVAQYTLSIHVCIYTDKLFSEVKTKFSLF